MTILRHGTRTYTLERMVDNENGACGALLLTERKELVCSVVFWDSTGGFVVNCNQELPLEILDKTIALAKEIASM